MDIQQLAEKLHQEGVAKGKTEAEKIVADARKNAEDIVAAAKKEAEEIVAKAKLESEKLLENGKNSLSLAARDVKLQLQEELSRILQETTSSNLEKVLASEEVLKNLLSTLLASYKDQLGSHQLTIDIDKLATAELENWLRQELKAEVKRQGKISGFCLQEKDGGKVEVTAESVEEAILPYLRGLARQIVTQEKAK